MGCSSSSAASDAPAKGGGEKTENVKGQASQQDKQAAKDENKLYQATMSFLSQVPLFMRLPRDQHPILAAACVNQPFTSGETIITQGEMGTTFFIIQSGEAEVSVDANGEAKKVATLKSGDYFGENALLRNEPRTATITATTEIKALKITREKFKELGLNDKIQFANRKAVGGGGKRKLEVKPPSEKTDGDREVMAKALQANENIGLMIKLDEQRTQEIIDVAWTEDVEAGKEIITEGDLTADYFYICKSGKFEVFVTEERKGGDKIKSKQKLVQTVTEGGSFGELALLYLVPRAASVKAVEDSTVWVIDRKNFKDILMKVSDKKIQDYVKYLSRDRKSVV